MTRWLPLLFALGCSSAGDIKAGDTASASTPVTSAGTTPAGSTPSGTTPTGTTSTGTTSTGTTSTGTTSTGTGSGSTTTTTLDVPGAALRINEVVVWNRSGPGDAEARRRDWIELYNPTAGPVSLAGLSITDDLDTPDRHAFDPAAQVPAGGTLLLWADGDPERGPDHLAFRLDADGETLGLFSGEVAIDTVTVGPLPPDLALARTPDGADDWRVEPPTPDAPNPASPRSGPVGASDCQPVITVAEPMRMEGDAASLVVACTGADALGDVEIRIVGAPPDADWDPATGALSWASGLSDGRRWDVVAEVKPPDGSAVPETAVGTVWIADFIENPANVPPIPSSYTEEWGVPVLHVHTDGAIGGDYLPAEVIFNGVSWTATIKKRGAASFGYPKNNYTLEFEPLQIDLSELGLGRKDHLVLISNFDDNAHTRQKLVYDTWDDMAAFEGVDRLVPRTAFVTVYLQGVYNGLYVAIDHIDDEFVGELGFDETGNLYKAVSHDANFYRTNAAGAVKRTLHDGWEKKEGEPLDDFWDLDALTAWVADASHDDFAAEHPEWLHIDEFMDWFLLVHHLAADDSAGKNAYIHHVGAGPFRYVPWDFNHALGQDWRTLRVDSWAYNDFTWNNGVFWHIQEHPELSAALWDRYIALRAPDAPLSAEALSAHLDTYYAQIDRSARRDWGQWETEYRDYGGWDWRGDWTDYDGEKAYLREWIDDRAEWADARHP